MLVFDDDNDAAAAAHDPSAAEAAGQAVHWSGRSLGDGVRLLVKQ
jgi:hypothetical protein